MEVGKESRARRVAEDMNLQQFLDYLASFTQTRQLAFALAEVAEDRNHATLRRSA
jgi:hypothetical protein